MNTLITGERLFLLYAFPCAEGMTERGRIGSKNYEKLRTLVLNGGQPSRRLLKTCFVRGFHALRDFARKIGMGDKVWSFEVVSQYWRHNHGREGDCQVILADIISTEGKIIQAFFERQCISVINLYNLCLSIGVKFYIHRRVIIECEIS